jgi:hypothetical protein
LIIESSIPPSFASILSWTEIAHEHCCVASVLAQVAAESIQDCMMTDFFCFWVPGSAFTSAAFINSLH